MKIIFLPKNSMIERLISFLIILISDIVSLQSILLFDIQAHIQKIQLKVFLRIGISIAAGNTTRIAFKIPFS